MICPRRDGISSSIFKIVPEEDSWVADSVCSYCGSLHPDKFMELVESGKKLIPTDKNYKVYMDQRKFYFMHLSEDQKKKFVELLNANKINFSTPGKFYVLPFFIGVKE